MDRDEKLSRIFKVLNDLRESDQPFLITVTSLHDQSEEAVSIYSSRMSEGGVDADMVFSSAATALLPLYGNCVEDLTLDRSQEFFMDCASPHILRFLDSQLQSHRPEVYEDLEKAPEPVGRFHRLLRRVFKRRS